MIELILKDIADPHVRENFFRINRFLNEQVWFEGDFQLYDVTIPGEFDAFKIRHGLTFIPADIIPLAAEGNYNFYFLYKDFDQDNMYVSTEGPVRIRFLAGKLKDQIKNKLASKLPFVAPGDIVGPASPGFVFGAVNTKTPGFWLTGEGIPSNVVGVPVLFGNGKVIQAAVGTETEANYTVGIYQHEGNGVGLLSLGSFNITVGGPKRVSLNFPVQYASPDANVQLACRLEAGTTQNLKVSLVLRGTSI